MVSDPGPTTLMQAAAVCRRFYVEGATKSQIASDLNLSRFQVARLLDLSRKRGIVKFQIDVPGNYDAELSERLRTTFSLTRAVVAVIPTEEATASVTRSRVGAAAADVLSETVTERDVLGIGWGRTLNCMVDSLRALARCPVVQMGGVIGSVHQNSLELVRKVTAINHGHPYPLYVPLIMQDANIATAMRAQAGINAAIRLFDSVTVGTVAIGSWEPPDSQLLSGLPEADRAILDDRNIVGEVCSTLLQDDGTAITELESRSVAITIDQLRRIPELMLVAGGAHKARAVRASLWAGVGTTLITDDHLAHTLLELGA